MAVIMAFSVMAGFGIFYADTKSALDFTPDRPIEFHDMNKCLFREREFNTKLSSQHPAYTDDWRNFSGVISNRSMQQIIHLILNPSLK